MWCLAAPPTLQAIGTGGASLILTVANTTLAANATQGSYSPWPVVTLYNSAGLPALPWAPTGPIPACSPGEEGSTALNVEH
jgi:hypothetical protein